jgi:F0F1-type ATP synthase epsilon subunit
MSTETQTVKQSSVDDNNMPLMRIKVYSPYQVYFDEDAYSISALNHTGPFDILPGHHNFMTLLVPCEIVIRSQDKKIIQRIRITQGVMHVKSNKTVVFLDV